MKIYLLGLPGSGKTTLGKAMSSLLNLPFVDLDSVIEHREGKTIREIFNEQGEDFFRRVESEELNEWCGADSGFVMATGGGTPCFGNNMEVIRRSGKSIFLDVPVEVIVSRMQQAEVSERPLLASTKSGELNEKIQSLRSARLAFYTMADIILSGGAITVTEAVEKINR